METYALPYDPEIPVVCILEGRERVVSEGFRRFMLHHRFQAEFCNPAAGNEKGNVENKVGYTRRNMLTPVPMIENFEVFNEALLARCDADHDREHYRQGEKISALWDAEREKLLTLPQYEYEVFRYESFVVDKTGFVTIDRNRYGVSPELPPHEGCGLRGDPGGGAESAGKAVVRQD